MEFNISQKASITKCIKDNLDTLKSANDNNIDSVINELLHKIQRFI